MPPSEFSRKPSTSCAKFWMGAGLVLMAAAFCLFAFFTQDLLPTKGTFGQLRNLHAVLGHFTAHPVRNAPIPLFALLSLLCITIAFLRSGRGQLLRFLNGRPGATILLLSVAACELPLYFSRGDMDGQDQLSHISAFIEASANYWIGQWPFYTFHFCNGNTLGLQYPMLRTLWGGMFNAVSPFNPQLNFQILSAGTHLFMIAGIYRLLRAWRFSRVACVIPALTLVGCHEMLLYCLSGSIPTFVASAFAVWCFQAFVRWISTLRLRNALASAYWFGFAVLGHPVTGLFTAYFLVPPILFFIVKSQPAERKRFVLHGCGFCLLSILIALPYLGSVVSFSHFNTYRPAGVFAFQDQGVRIVDNFRWITKYIGKTGDQSGGVERGEYISVILAALILAGLAMALSDRLAGRDRKYGPRYLGCFVLWMAGAGAVLFYGRDTAWVSAIPAVKLLKVNNRSFIFFALGLAMLAAKPIDALLRKNHSSWVLVLGVLLLIEQAPYWLRPTYFSLPENQRLHADEFGDYNRETASFLVICPLGSGEAGNREDVAFHRAGFSGISPIEHEEQSIVGFESEQFHIRLAGLKSAADAQPIIDRLKWLRVTDVIWRSDVLPPFDLTQLGTVRAITNGVALHLNGPTMTRDLRGATLSVVPGDVREGSSTVLPVGFSPFLHCWASADRQQEIPLTDRNGYATIERALPVGAALDLKAITPLWLSLATWVSVAGSLCASFLLIGWKARRSARSTRAA